MVGFFDGDELIPWDPFLHKNLAKKQIQANSVKELIVLDRLPPGIKGKPPKYLVK